jgi:outer membrane protein
MKRRSLVVLPFLFLIVRFSIAQEEVSLEQVVALALEQNYDVKVSQKVSDQAKTDNSYAVGAFLPQITASGSKVWNNNNQELRFQDVTRNNKGKAESNNVTGTVALAWTLFDGTRMFATRERISVIADQGELLVKNQMVNTIASIITNYYDIVRQKQQLKAIQEQMSVSEERVKLAEKKLQVGTGIKPELLQAKVDYNAQRTQVFQQESAIAQLKEQLNGLVGLKLPSVYDVADTILIDLNLVQDDRFKNLQNTNYSLMAARENVAIANLTLRERRAEYLPFVNFNAAYNYNRVNNVTLINPFGSTFSLTNGLNYGFTVSLPIFTGLNTRRLNQRARIEVDRQQLLYEQQTTAINVNVRNAFVTYENAKKILQVEEETIGLAKENVFIALESFKRGLYTFIELRTAQQSLAEAYNRLISARFNAKVAETELLRLNGGLLK